MRILRKQIENWGEKWRNYIILSYLLPLLLHPFNLFSKIWPRSKNEAASDALTDASVQCQSYLPVSSSVDSTKSVADLRGENTKVDPIFRQIFQTYMDRWGFRQTCYSPKKSNPFPSTTIQLLTNRKGYPP